MQFHEWKVLYFDYNSLKFVPKGPIHSIGLDNGSAPNRRQAIIWTNPDPIHWRLYAALREMNQYIITLNGKDNLASSDLNGYTANIKWKSLVIYDGSHEVPLTRWQLDRFQKKTWDNWHNVLTWHGLLMLLVLKPEYSGRTMSIQWLLNASPCVARASVDIVLLCKPTGPRLLRRWVSITSSQY